MSLPTESEKRTQPIRQAAEAKDAESALALTEANDANTQQSTLLGTAALDDQYRAALDEQVLAKRTQADRIEDRLETLIGQEESIVNARSAQRPSFLRPGAVAKWREDLSAAQEVLQRLHNRLEHVRELRDGMATHGPRLQELAAERLRHQKPHLVDAWEELQEAHRLGLLALRARAQSIRQTQTGGMRLGLVVE